MWIMTDLGFFGIVEKPGGRTADRPTTRARVPGDLEAPRAAVPPDLGATVEGGGTDHRYRAAAPRKRAGGSPRQSGAEAGPCEFQGCGEVAPMGRARDPAARRAALRTLAEPRQSWTPRT
jgi:hypothetical protein